LYYNKLIDPINYIIKPFIKNWFHWT
jgi:hypothetical protein